MGFDATRIILNWIDTKGKLIEMSDKKLIDIAEDYVIELNFDDPVAMLINELCQRLIDKNGSV